MPKLIAKTEYPYTVKRVSYADNRIMRRWLSCLAVVKTTPLEKTDIPSYSQM
ncbi:MAG: hypothetical protein LBB88_11680 [Planctomycetaceae bacterium]|nr:hypothetical protein [Planctomycetaceae bacterium]